VAIGRMKHWGFVDACASTKETGSGEDIESSQAIALVRIDSSIRRALVQQLLGIAMHLTKKPMAFSLKGYTKDALTWGSEAGIALFELDLSGQVEPLTTAASRLFAGDASFEVETEHTHFTIMTRGDAERVATAILAQGKSESNRAIAVTEPDLAMALAVGLAMNDPNRVLRREGWELCTRKRNGAEELSQEFLAKLASLDEGDVLFVQGLDQVPADSTSALLRCASTFETRITLGHGIARQSLSPELPRLSFVGTVQESGRLTRSMREFFDYWVIQGAL